MLALLDWLLDLIHTAVVIGNLSLWAFRKTRLWHLALVLATAASWFGLGLWYGLGYCFLTDWHWQIKTARGITELPHAFIQYLVYGVGGTSISPATINTVAGIAFATVFVLSVALNVRDAQHRKRQRSKLRVELVQRQK